MQGKGTSKRPLPRNEAQPAAADPLAAPTYLDAVALQKWHYLAPKLAQLGLLTELDVDMLAMYCQTWSDWRSVRAAIAGLKDAVEVVATGMSKREKELRTSLRQLAAEFGFSPATRSRVPAPPPAGDDAGDPMEQFMKGGGDAPGA